eukprot:Phypoly_transcript_13789.p1 GENE.Phypoly_transcript_13789~~Phypoly_transcript_13789.p1  ORF type:complete len:254 (-),score=60.15 Phypoly_transcript_13789:250-1011(-)
MATREEWVFMAKVAEQAERYEEMVEAMRHVIMTEPRELSLEERNLLSVAYKNVVGQRRASWRIISSCEQKQGVVTENMGKEEREMKEYLARKCAQYREKIEEELRAICGDMLLIIQEHLLRTESALERVFFLKMKGDYTTYMAEVSTGPSRAEYARASSDAYTQSADEAAQGLRATDPIRLGMALSYSCYFYEILNQPERALRIAKQAFDSALEELDDLTEDNYKEATLQMQLLRDNITLWTSDMELQGNDHG